MNDSRFGISTFETERTDQGYVYRLPVRDLSEIAHYGWVLIGFGVVGCLFMIAWMSGPAVIGFQMLKQAPWFGVGMIGFGALGLLGFSHAAKILAGGICLKKNRTQCEVSIRGKHLYSTELLGWFRWNRRMKISEIKSFEVVRSKPRDSPERLDKYFKLGNLLTINALGANDKKLLVAPAYGENVLEPLAQELANHLNKLNEPLVPNREWETKPSVSKVAVTSVVVDDDAPEFLAQPKNSNVAIVDVEETRAYNIPPAGVKGTRGFLFFGIVWLLFSLGIGGALLFDMLRNGFDTDELIGIGVLALFIIVGVLMVLAAINMARRSVMIGVRDGLLFLERKSIFGTKWLEYDRDNITQIAMGPSGTRVNDVAIMELQIFNREGKKFGLLSQLENEELKWLAFELNQQLGLGPNELGEVALDATRDSNWPQPPVNSQATLVNLSDRSLKIKVAAKGLMSSLVSIAGSYLIMLLGIAAMLVIIVWCGELFVGLILGLTMTAIGGAVGTGHLMYAMLRFRFQAEGDSLTITRSGLFTRREFKFQRPLISSISVAPSEWSVNHSRLMQLTIFSPEKKLALMLGRRQTDLSFVATHLENWRTKGSEIQAG